MQRNNDDKKTISWGSRLICVRFQDALYTRMCTSICITSPHCFWLEKGDVNKESVRDSEPEIAWRPFSDTFESNYYFFDFLNFHWAVVLDRESNDYIMLRYHTPPPSLDFANSPFTSQEIRNFELIFIAVNDQTYIVIFN